MAHLKKTSIAVQQVCNVQQYEKQHKFLFALLPKNGVLFECDGQAPSPSKDYGQLQLTLDKVILRWWKISLRNNEDTRHPGEIKDSYEDFYHDEAAQREVWRFFGPVILNYCLALVRGQFDWLVRLPLPIQIRILSYVDLNDIPQLSLVCKLFHSLCRSNDLWRVFYIRQYGRSASQRKDLVHLAERRGWRHVFFTNRLKLQMELRREAQLDYHQEDPSDLLNARQRRPQMQPSPPTTPRQDRFAQPSIRRHSFTTRKEPMSLSPLPNREGSPRTPRSYIDEMEGSPRTRRLPSPALSVRANAGSPVSTASTPTPAPRSTTRR